MIKEKNGDLPSINELLEVKLDKSPFGDDYIKDSYIKVVVNGENTTYHICLSDGTRGIDQDSASIDKDNVKDIKTCTATS